MHRLPPVRPRRDPARTQRSPVVDHDHGRRARRDDRPRPADERAQGSGGVAEAGAEAVDLEADVVALVVGDPLPEGAERGIRGVVGEGVEVARRDRLGDEEQADLRPQPDEMPQPGERRVGPVRGQRGRVEMVERAEEQGRVLLLLLHEERERVRVGGIARGGRHPEEVRTVAALPEREPLERADERPAGAGVERRGRAGRDQLLGRQMPVRVGVEVGDPVGGGAHAGGRRGGACGRRCLRDRGHALTLGTAMRRPRRAQEGLRGSPGRILRRRGGPRGGPGYVLRPTTIR
ncbi:hypothetical protein CMMCAS03_09200 [Clavibacter michiganensis subsp. michiganensis]|nr:hypothetical protein CMMCAS03_09200 [Clavibacter michiganensis subsp. michiganensis]